MFKNTVLFSLIVWVLAMTPSVYAGKVELTTYYPAPMGEYDTLQSNTLKLVPKSQPVCNAAAEGMMYYDSSTNQVQVCDGSSWGTTGGNPPGMVSAFAMSAAPSGWLVCNGAAVSRSNYAALFAAIGTTHGTGDGSSTFNLPDYRGYFLRGLGGVDPDVATRTLGSIQTDDFKSHAHTANGAIWGTSSPVFYFSSGSTVHYGRQGGTTEGTGGTETRPKNRAVVYCIKY